ncbi:TPA: glycosyltransferase family 4 protein [Candidatus Micrarchaeota archaeon]|nr:glycosyltransferase family 4 protein [Candidatus Micrarchaeota archaeon]
MDKYLSICSVSQSFLPFMGGLTKYVNALGKRFIRDGHDFRVMHFKAQNLDAIDFSSGIPLLRTNVEGVGTETMAGYMRFKECLLNATHLSGEIAPDPKTLPEFSDYLKVSGKIKEYVLDTYGYKPFDILHIHDFQLLPLAGMLKGLAVPKVFTFHIPFSGGMLDNWKRFIAGYMTDYDRVVLSTEEYVSAASAAGLPDNKITRIYPFIDAGEYTVLGENDAREKLGIGKSDFLILCVSRMDPRKGQEVLVQAMETVAKQFPEAKCVFVGNGSFTQKLMGKERGGYRESLVSLAHTLGVSRQTVFTGYLPDAEVNKLYATCDAVVQPSVHEGFGLTVSQGMLFGKPVVGSNIGGIPVQIKDGISGYLFETGDAGQLAGKLTILAKDPGLRARMGEEGKRIFGEKFDSEIGYREHLELYNGLLQG